MMGKAIRAQNLGPTVATVLVAALLILLVVLAFGWRSVATTSDMGDQHAMNAGNIGASTITQDPYFERHAEVVQRLGNGRLH